MKELIIKPFSALNYKNMITKMKNDNPNIVILSKKIRGYTPKRIEGKITDINDTFFNLQTKNYKDSIMYKELFLKEYEIDTSISL